MPARSFQYSAPPVSAPSRDTRQIARPDCLALPCWPPNTVTARPRTPSIPIPWHEHRHHSVLVFSLERLSGRPSERTREMSAADGGCGGSPPAICSVLRRPGGHEDHGNVARMVTRSETGGWSVAVRTGANPGCCAPSPTTGRRAANPCWSGPAQPVSPSAPSECRRHPP